MEETYSLPREPAYEEYWSELGRFIHQFAEIERSAQILLRTCAGVSGAKGAALFSNVKIEAAVQQINRLLDAEGKSAAKERLKLAFDQLLLINSVRNNIVHWGATAEDTQGLLVSNRYLAHTKERIKEYRVTPNNLRAMTRDLMKLTLHLQWEGLSDEQRARSVVYPVIKPIIDEPWWFKAPKPARKKPPGCEPGAEG